MRFVKDKEPEVEQKIEKKRSMLSIKSSLIASALIVAAASLFLSGWLFGSGRLSVATDGSPLSPVIDRAAGNAPDEGLDEIYSRLVQNYDGDIENEDILNGIKTGLAESAGDPYTEYLNEEASKAFKDDLNGQFEGIGAELGKEGNFVIIVAPLKGLPAEKAGVRPQDVIVTIDGEPATDISIQEAVTRIRGPKGEEVTLGIIRDGEQLDITIVRDTIVIASVEWRQEEKLGIIEISRFGDDTFKLVEEAAKEFKDAGVSGVVVDLRSNPGGLLDMAVDVASVWLDKGSTVLLEKQDGKVVNTYTTRFDPLLDGVPTTILLNEGSASASEIVAGALRDAEVAEIVGKTSYGKGSVQRLIPLDYGGTLKVTIARWFTPLGTTIDEEGIAPDHEVDFTAEDREAEEDPQLDKALELLR